MKKIFKLLVVMLLVFTGCSKTQIVDDFRIVDSYRKDYNLFRVNYGSTLKNVKLQGVPVESGSSYYVEPGDYILTYEYAPKVSFNMTVNYNNKTNNKNRDKRYIDDKEKELIAVYEDTEMTLDEKNIEVFIEGTTGN
ncbi:hypothetical protein [Ilyobacter polytropus]|uniref:Lipoprotein n=1 Tax=Ilyobacter polytropus (strain ATCC 51220 / DSM 2926 / LMG 16218 / CuHBu1) TaxID=572544 RepID=E3HAP1_ILYPC|nr:hypothetical protein [Ilyobacter polytropus]ADO83228.1 hypothetical protein Ilyop_1448 [Ilyobacter polytropus DSM 2926]